MKEPENPSTPPEKFVLTGVSPEEFGAQLKNLHHTELEGMAPEPQKRCYLCKRRDGTGTIMLKHSQDEVLTGNVVIKPVEVELDDGSALFYFLCQECIWLLSGFPRPTESETAAAS